jgi:hypothetical protein
MCVLRVLGPRTYNLLFGFDNRQLHSHSERRFHDDATGLDPPILGTLLPNCMFWTDSSCADQYFDCLILLIIA